MALTIANSIGMTSSQSDLTLLGKFQAALCNVCPVSAGLAIATSKAKVKFTGTLRYFCGGVLCAKAATDNFWTLSGTILTATYNVFLLGIDASGTAVAQMGTAGASLAAVVFPTPASTTTVLGFVIVAPSGTGSFVGGTTELDDATVVPNAVYVNTSGIPTTLFAL